MKFLSLAIVFTATTSRLSQAIEVDCSMADTTPCDCIFGLSPTDTLPGTDCRVCRVEKQLACVLWHSSGTRYGPLCEDPNCSSSDQTCTPTNCYTHWTPKPHARVPCPTPAGDCKCAVEVRGPSETSTSVLPGETCTVCPIDGAKADTAYYCTERGNGEVKYGPLCMGAEITPSQCPGKKKCACNWMVSQEGAGWVDV